MTTILPLGWLKGRKKPPVVVNVQVKTDIDPRKVAEAVRREILLHAARNSAPPWRSA